MDRLLSRLARRLVPGVRGGDRRLQGGDGGLRGGLGMLCGIVDQILQLALLLGDPLTGDVCEFQLGIRCDGEQLAVVRRCLEG